MKLDSLELWLDEQPHDAALNMALDEAMLLASKGPWMRVYRWASPSLSLGFSQDVGLVPEEKRHWPLVRRWTGGGLVVHDNDWTYTLAAPTGSALCESQAGETYRWIHQAIINALDSAGLPGGLLQPEHTSDGMGVCFVEPARYDVVWRDRKIAGAAQRRTKVGFLHQGSVQDIELPTDFGRHLAKQLASDVHEVDHTATLAALKSKASQLVLEKYGQDSWTQHRTAQSLLATS